MQMNLVITKKWGFLDLGNNVILAITVVPQKRKDFAYELRGEGRGEGVEVGWGGHKVY